jgi:hypothetical protein
MAPDGTPRLGALDIAISVALAAACAVCWVYLRSGFPVLPAGMDGEEWVGASEALARGDLPAYGRTWRPPGYPWLIAALVPFGIDAHDATILAPMGFAAGTVGVAWLVGVAAAGAAAPAATRSSPDRLTDPASRRRAVESGAIAAWITACALGTANTAFSTNSQALFDLLVALLAGVAIWALTARSAGAAMLRWASAGLLVGCAAAVKEQGVPLLVLGALAAWLGGAASAQGGAGRRALVGFACVLLFMLAAAGPASSLAWAADLQALHGDRGSKLSVMLDDVRLLMEARDWRTARIHNGSWRPPGVVPWTWPGLGGLVLWSSMRSLGVLVSTVGVAALLGLAALPALRGAATRSAVLVCLSLLLPLAPTFVVAAYPSFHYAFATVPLAVLAGVGVARLASRGSVWRRTALGVAFVLPLVPFGDGFEQGGPIASFRRQVAYYASADFFTLCHQLAASSPDARVVTPVGEMAFLQTLPGPCANVVVARVPAEIPYGEQIRVYDDRQASFTFLHAMHAAGRLEPQCREVLRVDHTPSGRHLRALRCPAAEAP